MTDGWGVCRRAMLNMAAAAAVITGLDKSAFAADTKPVRVTNPSGGFSLIFQELLKRGNYLEKFGVDGNFINVSDAMKVIASEVSGAGDMTGGSGISGLFPAIEKGAKVKLIGATITTSVLAVYTKKVDIKEAKDLIGKTVGIGAPGTLLHQAVVAMLVKQGVDYNKVNFVNVGSSLQVLKAVSAGVVDAGPSTFDFYPQRAKYGLHTLSDGILWNDLPEYTDEAMFASEDAIIQNRNGLIRMMAAHAAMFRDISKPDSFSVFYKARTAALSNDDPEEARTQWQFFQTPGRLGTNLVLSEERVSYIQGLNVKLGIQQKTLPYAQCVDNSLAQDALKLLGSGLIL